MPPALQPAQQLVPHRPTAAQRQCHGFRPPTPAFEGLTPTGWGPIVPGVSHLRTGQELLQGKALGKDALLLISKLQAGGHGQGVPSPNQQGRNHRDAKTAGPMQTPAPVLIRLQPSIQQGKGTPVLQMGKGNLPGLPLHQQGQLHTKPARQCRWCQLRGLARAPGPGPVAQGGSQLLQRLWRQIKTKPRRIPGSPDHTGGVISNAAAMEKQQLPGL